MILYEHRASGNCLKTRVMLDQDSGEFLPESNAILLHLAEGTQYLPSDPVARARVHGWLMFEQNQIEANLGVARFLAMSGRAASVPEVFADRQRRARDAIWVRRVAALPGFEEGLAPMPAHARDRSL